MVEERIAQTVDFKNKKTRLFVLGILDILLAGFWILMIPVEMLDKLLSVNNKNIAEQLNWQIMSPRMLFFAVMAVLFFVIGIGSIKTRQWARTLILIISWFWLVCGLLMLLFLPVIFDQFRNHGVIDIFEFGRMVLRAIFSIVLPGLLILFYGGRDVKATCQYKDHYTRQREP
jgi:hypothetical protein